MMARVLIVQGHARSRADAAATLRAEGHDVLEAGSADNGVRLAHDQGPEVILLDPMLPDRSGYELYASLQRDPATVAIPVLFLPGELPSVPGGGEGELVVALPDIVTRLGLALRTKSLNDELRLADVSLRSAVLTDSRPAWPPPGGRGAPALAHRASDGPGRCIDELAGRRDAFARPSGHDLVIVLSVGYAPSATWNGGDIAGASSAWTWPGLGGGRRCWPR